MRLRRCLTWLVFQDLLLNNHQSIFISHLSPLEEAWPKAGEVFHSDVVIIGGSLAGATCARELTRLGVDAIAIERDTFPRHKVCGGFLSPGAVDCLDELGLLGAVRSAVGAVDVDHARIHADGQEFEVCHFRVKGLGIYQKRTGLHARLQRKGRRSEQGTNVRAQRPIEGRWLHCRYGSPVALKRKS